MTWKTLVVVPLLALMPLVTGCGADCESLCEDSNEKCEGENLDCADVCGDLESLNEKGGCEDSYDEAVSCRGDQDDICKKDVCTSEDAAYTQCVFKYCSAHPTDASCIIG